MKILPKSAYPEKNSHMSHTKSSCLTKDSQKVLTKSPHVSINNLTIPKPH